MFTGLVVVPAAAIAVSTVLAPSRHTPAILLTAALAALLGWVVFWRPTLSVTESELVVVNPWRTYRVAWTDLVDVQTRLMLTLVTDTRKIEAVAAPGPSGVTALRARPDPERKTAARRRGAGPAIGDWGQRPSDLVSTDSGAAARLVRGHWQDIVEGRVTPPVSQEQGPSASFHTGAALATWALALAAVCAWIIA
ncbi:hypothetical protein KILIM_077_00120 [Kineosphaera limosa NBRC 100340]|uniref:PH domain-containing protein n=1 Tax=Kineosphaera limosa NBRC 100340 TaxID=1184609 RepID=K6WED1_9MICO|nr:hypothetical protein KILIM_077_00120 [Kineosphaera limosa NBRC 100340]